MGRNPARDVNAERSNLGLLDMAGGTGAFVRGARRVRSGHERAVTRPNPSPASDSLGGNSVVRTGTYQHFLKPAYKLDDAHAAAGFAFRGEPSQIKYGIGHQLPGTVKGDIAPAVRFKHLDPTLRQQFGRGQDILGLRIATQSDHRRM